MPSKIVLVGAGHAHLGVLRDCGKWKHDVTCVSPGDFWYSGLATGTLGGRHERDANRVDVAALCRRAEVRFVRQKVVGLDAAAKRIALDDGSTLGYDVLSLDVGSEVQPPPGLELDGERVFAVKPIAALSELRATVERLADELRRRQSEMDEADERGGLARATALVVGGGYSGCETALNLVAQARHIGLHLGVFLAINGDEPGRHLPEEPQAELAATLRRAGVKLNRRARVLGQSASEGGGLLFDAERVLSLPPLRPDLVLLATGLHPPPLIDKLDLPTTDTGRLRLRDTLQVDGHDHVFAAGDCASLAGRELPKNGVVAVRQSKVLLHNLPAAAAGRSLRRYRPRKNHLLILNLADGTGLAVYGRWHYRGRLALWVKDYIDKKFVASLS